MMFVKRVTAIVGIIVVCFTCRIEAAVNDLCYENSHCTEANEVCNVPETKCACASGYVDPGDLTCVPVDCGSLNAPSNGMVDTSAGTTYNQVATYTCNTGYEVSGTATRTCGSDTLWTGTKPTCVRKDCGVLTDPSNGGVDLTSGTQYEAVAVYSCDTGYSISGSQTRACLQTGLWQGVSPTCEIKDCGTLTAPQNAVVVTPSGTTYTQIATYVCNSGYTMVGTNTRTCQSTGIWSGTEPSCDANACSPLNNPANGVASTPDGTEYGNVATYTCDSGYTLSGTSKRICNADGSWSDTAPTCGLTDCGTPYILANGYFTTNGGTSYGAFAVYYCNANYGIVGDANVACEASGFWGTLPTCSADCGSPPTVANAIVDTSGGTLLGTTVTYTCNAGYTLSGSGTISCRTDSTWSDTPLCQLGTATYQGLCSITSQCITQNATCMDDGSGDDRCMCSATGQVYESVTDHCMSDCGSLTAPTHGTITLPTLTVEGQMVLYACDPGYAVEGVSSRTCLPSGLWSDSTPTCDIGCPHPRPPLNGNVNSSSGTAAGDKIEYTCNEGYALVGSNERVCLIDATWNGDEPICAKECSSLSGIQNGRVDLSRGNWDTSVATYICDKNYGLVGTSTRICKSTGAWSGTEPNCIYAIYPDVVIVFAVLLAILILVDIFIVGFWLYLRYFKPKSKPKGKDAEENGPSSDEENKYLDILDDKNESGLPPVTYVNSQSRNTSFRRSKHGKVVPESPRNHPPPRLIQAIPRKPLPKAERFPYRELRNKPSYDQQNMYGSEQSLYRTDPAKKWGEENTTALKAESKPPFVPLLMSNPPKSTQPHKDLLKSDLRREPTFESNLHRETTLDLKDTHELTVEDLLKDDFRAADSGYSTNKEAPSPPEADQSFTPRTFADSEQKGNDSEPDSPRGQDYIMEEVSTARSNKPALSFQPAQ